MRARLTARARMVTALVVALGALAGAVVLVARARAHDRDVGHLTFASTSAAPAPFGKFSQARVAVGSTCLRLLVASSERQRVQGLRGVHSLTPFEGMLFVFPRDTRSRFTMADTPTALDITFFSSGGEPVDRAQMAPCPAGSDATCPEYASRQRYRYALEQPAGANSATGAIGACAA